MVGENFDLGSPPTGYDKGKVALSVKNLSVPAPGGGYSVVDRLSLDVRAGEIVCIYGLMGAGRTEMMETVARPVEFLVACPGIGTAGPAYGVLSGNPVEKSRSCERPAPCTRRVL
jgi:ATPase subunit of ABC transporter with duplicated ATPase domains